MKEKLDLRPWNWETSEEEDQIGPRRTRQDSRIGIHKRIGTHKRMGTIKEKEIGQPTLTMTAGKHSPLRCTILQKLAKVKDGASPKEEAKEKEETKEKEKDSKEAATFVANGGIRQRIVPKAKEKEKETSKEDSKEKEKDSKETAGHVAQGATLQQIAQKEKERAKEEKD